MGLENQVASLQSPAPPPLGELGHVQLSTSIGGGSVLRPQDWRMRWDILWPDVSTIFYCRLMHHNTVVFFVIWWCWWFSTLTLPRQSSEGQPGPGAAKRVLWQSPVPPEWSVWGGEGWGAAVGSSSGVGRGADRRPRSTFLTLTLICTFEL